MTPPPTPLVHSELHTWCRQATPVLQPKCCEYPCCRPGLHNCHHNVWRLDTLEGAMLPPQKLHSTFEGMFAVNKPQQMPGHPPILLCMLLTDEKRPQRSLEPVKCAALPALIAAAAAAALFGREHSLAVQQQEAPSIRTHTCPGLRLNRRGNATGCNKHPMQNLLAEPPSCTIQRSAMPSGTIGTADRHGSFSLCDLTTTVGAAAASLLLLSRLQLPGSHITLDLIQDLQPQSKQQSSHTQQTSWQYQRQH
jgi:hypothetical protein